jgi:hypothetical protein
MSAYFLFCKDHRKDVVKANPDKKITEIAKLLAKDWKAASSSDKKKYEKKAAEGKEKYEKEMKEYKKKKGKESPKSSPKKKTTKSSPKSSPKKKTTKTKKAEKEAESAEESS